MARSQECTAITLDIVSYIMYSWQGSRTSDIRYTTWTVRQATRSRGDRGEPHAPMASPTHHVELPSPHAGPATARGRSASRVSGGVLGQLPTHGRGQSGQDLYAP